MGIGLLERRQLKKQLNQRHEAFRAAYTRLLDALKTSQEEDRLYLNSLKIHVDETGLEQLEEQWETLQAVHRKIIESIVDQRVFGDMYNGLFDQQLLSTSLARVNDIINKDQATSQRLARIKRFWSTVDVEQVITLVATDARNHSGPPISEETYTTLGVDAKIIGSEPSPEQSALIRLSNNVRHFSRWFRDDQWEYFIEQQRWELSQNIVNDMDKLQTDMEESLQPFVQAQTDKKVLSMYEALFTDTDVSKQYLTDMTDTVTKAHSMLSDAVDNFRQAVSRFDPEHLHEDRSLEDLDKTGEQMTDLLGVMRGLALEE